MDLKSFTLIDDQFAVAEFATDNGAVRVEAELMPAGLPVHIDSANWIETGEDASADLREELDTLRTIIAARATEVLVDA